MTGLIADPQIILSAAADVEQIGAAIRGASAAALSATPGLSAPAEDEVSMAMTKLFDSYSQAYHAAVAQAAAFHDEFTEVLAAAASAYAAVEAGNAAAMSGLLGALTVPVQSLLGGCSAPGAVRPLAAALTSTVTDPLVSTAIVIGGAGGPIPSPAYVAGVLNWAAHGGVSWTNVQALFTPEGGYPLTGVKSLPLATSVTQGVQILDAAIKQDLATAGSSVLVQAYSQSSVIASLEMQNLLAAGSPYTGSQLYFNLLADPMNPNGGVLARFPGLNLPSLGLDFYGATPANTPWTTNIFSLEYDGFADFPQYPINILSDLNAVAGIVFVHPNYPDINPATLPSGDIVHLATSPDYTGPSANTNYYMVPTQNLPLLDPLRFIPVVGNPLADLLQPDLTYLVNCGYGNPNFGYSTGPANVATPFGLFPHINPTILAGDLVTGAQQGIAAAAGDFTNEGQSFLSGLSLPDLSPTGTWPSLPSISLPSPSALLSPTSIDGVIQSLQTANTNFAIALSSATSDSYSALLPTADIVNAALISIPSYDTDLLLNGIAQTVSGNPAGLINAIGDPLAATTGLLALLGGFEVLTLIEGAAAVTEDFIG